MNQDQILSIVRAALQIAGTLLVSKGVFTETDWTTIAGAATMLVPIGWGVYVHSQAQKIAAVSVMPEVKAMTLSDPALAGAAKAADPSVVVTLVRPRAAPVAGAA